MNNTQGLFYAVPQKNGVSDRDAGEAHFNSRFTRCEPPRRGCSLSFGFGSSLVISGASTRIFSLGNLLFRDEEKESLDSVGADADKRLNDAQFSSREIESIRRFIDRGKKRNEDSGSKRNYLELFRNNCLLELFSASLSKGSLVSTPADYDLVFSGIKSILGYGIWMCSCEANGKPVEYVSKRSLLGLHCGTLGVSKTLERYRADGNGCPDSTNTGLSWSDRFALSGFCGERELSLCYFDYVKDKGARDTSDSGIVCDCFGRIVDLLYLCIAQKTEYFEIDQAVLELWPHYVYSVAVSLGTTHLGSRSLLTRISNCLLTDIREMKSRLTLNEKITAIQFCNLLLGEYKELTCGVSIRNVSSYMARMDLISLFLARSNKWDPRCLLNQYSILYMYWVSLHTSEAGDQKGANRRIEHASLLLSSEKGTQFQKHKLEFEFLKHRVRDMNRKLLKAATESEQALGQAVSQSDRQDSHKNNKHSSWLVGWISDNIKKAIAQEEERWPGVENTFYFDKEINQWCQRGPDGQRITNGSGQSNQDATYGHPGSDCLPRARTPDLHAGDSVVPSLSPPPPPPPPSSSRSALAPNGSSANVYSGLGSGIRSRYVDIFQSAKQ